MCDDDERVAERLMNLELRDASRDEDDDDSQSEEAEDLDWLMERILSENSAESFAGVQTLRRRTSDNAAGSFKRLIRSEAMKVLINSLKQWDQPELQFESAWAFTNLLANQGSCAAVATVRTAVQPLVKLLTSDRDCLREQACWALANLIGESPEFRDAALDAGLADALPALCGESESSDVLDGVSLLLVNVFRDREPRVRSEVARRLTPLILGLLDSGRDNQLVQHSIWALSYLVEESETRISMTLEAGAMPAMRRLLNSDDPGVLVPALRFFGNVSAGVQQLPAEVLANGLLDRMHQLLKHEDVKIRRQVLFFVCNVSDGPEDHLEMLEAAQLLRDVGRVLLEADEGEKRESFWMVPNFCISRAAKFKNLVIDQCLEGFLEILSLQDPELTQCVLMTVRELLFAARYRRKDEMDFDALKRKIERCGGLKKVELVQKMDNKELSSMSYEIIDHFFWGNEKKYINAEAGSCNEEEEAKEEKEVGRLAECKVGDDFQEEKGETRGDAQGLMDGLQQPRLQQS